MAKIFTDSEDEEDKGQDSPKMDFIAKKPINVAEKRFVNPSLKDPLKPKVKEGRFQLPITTNNSNPPPQGNMFKFKKEEKPLQQPDKKRKYIEAFEHDEEPKSKAKRLPEPEAVE